MSSRIVIRVRLILCSIRVRSLTCPFRWCVICRANARSRVQFGLGLGLGLVSCSANARICVRINLCVVSVGVNVGAKDSVSVVHVEGSSRLRVYYNNGPLSLRGTSTTRTL